MNLLYETEDSSLTINFYKFPSESMVPKPKFNSFKLTQQHNIYFTHYLPGTTSNYYKYMMLFPCSPTHFIVRLSIVIVIFVVVDVSTTSRYSCYAQEQQNPLTMNGGSLLAMAGNGCVAMAVDKRFGSGPQMVNVVPRQVWAPHPNLMVGFSGLEGDVQSLSEELKMEIEYKRNRELGFSIASSGLQTDDDDDDNNDEMKGRRISPPALACLTSHVLYEKRGYYVEPLVVGLMETTRKPFLCAMDMIGAQSFSKSFICSGAASTSLYGTAEALWKPNMEPKELLECCGKVFQSAIERDCLSGYGILIYLITKDGIAEYDLASRND